MKIKDLKVMPVALAILVGGVVLTGCSNENTTIEEMALMDTLEQHQEMTLLDEHLQQKEISIYDSGEFEHVTALEGLQKVEYLLKLTQDLTTIVEESIDTISGYSREDLPTLREEIFNYTVDEGDTLSELAEKYSTSVEKMIEDNNLSGDLLQPGQHLLIETNSVYTPMTQEEIEVLEEVLTSEESYYGEKIAAISKIHLERQKAEKWLKENANAILETSAITTIKSATVEACGYEPEKIDEMRLCAASNLKHNFDSIISVRENGVVEDTYGLDANQALYDLLDDVYHYQTTQSDEFGKKQIDRYTKTINSIKEVVESKKTLEKGLFSDTIKLK